MENNFNNMKWIITIINSFFIHLTRKYSTDSNRTEMNSQLETYIKNTINIMLNSGSLSMDIQNDIYIDGKLDIVKLVFSKSENCYITIIFKFIEGNIYTSIGEINGGENEILLFKNFFNTICEFSQNIKGSIEQTYRNYYNISIQNNILP